jgi:hypothetical protein
MNTAEQINGILKIILTLQDKVYELEKRIDNLSLQSKLV